MSVYIWKVIIINQFFFFLFFFFFKKSHCVKVWIPQCRIHSIFFLIKKSIVWNYTPDRWLECINLTLNIFVFEGGGFWTFTFPFVSTVWFKRFNICWKTIRKNNWLFQRGLSSRWITYNDDLSVCVVFYSKNILLCWDLFDEEILLCSRE